MNEYKNELEHFIYKKCYERIFEVLAVWCRENPNTVKSPYARVKYPDTAVLKSFLVKFSNNVIIEEDNIFFDVILDCTIELKEQTENNIQTDLISSWVRVSCTVTVEDEIKSFTIRSIETYEKKHIPKSGKEADGNFVPIISKKNLDNEATHFLEKYYPEALNTPMPVPIEEIVKNKMHLEIITGKRLTDNFNFFGQICFSAGKVKVFYPKFPKIPTVSRIKKS